MRKFLLFILIYVISYSILFSQSQIDFWLALPDNVKLDCTKFIPNGNPPSPGWPAVIFCHGFGGSKNDVIDFAENLSKYGYCTYAYSMRGQGNSTGYSNLMSKTEMNDLLRVISLVKSDSLVDPQKVGLMGSSQGGIISFMAACYSANVSCIVSDLISPEFATSWTENGCVKMSLLWSLGYDSSKVRYNNSVKSFRKWILSDKKDKWDSLALYLPKERDFLDKVKDMQIPILISGSWQDKFFNPGGILKASNMLSVSHKIYLGAVQGHGSDTTFQENLYHSEFIEKWIEYWLKDIQNHILDSDKITFSVSSEPVNFNHWTYTRYGTNFWPPEGVHDVRFYFQPNKKLSFNNELYFPDTVSFLNDVRDNSLKMIEALNEKFTGGIFSSKFQKNYIYFETEPLDRDYLLAGTPQILLFYSSDADICQYNFQIWEVYQNGQMNFITRINYTDRHYYPGLIKTKWLLGTPDAHLFKKGSRIRVYVTNIDNGPNDVFLSTNPYVLPVLKRSRNVIYMSAMRQSYIELPLKEE